MPASVCSTSTRADQFASSLASVEHAKRLLDVRHLSLLSRAGHAANLLPNRDALQPPHQRPQSRFPPQSRGRTPGRVCRQSILIPCPCSRAAGVFETAAEQSLGLLLLLLLPSHKLPYQHLLVVSGACPAAETLQGRLPSVPHRAGALGLRQRSSRALGHASSHGLSPVL